MASARQTPAPTGRKAEVAASSDSVANDRLDIKIEAPKSEKGAAQAVETNFPGWVIAQSRKSAHCVDYGKLVAVAESVYSSLLPHQIEQVQKAFLRHVLSGTDGEIIDATAHVGCDTLSLATIYPEARITAIEPNVDAFAALRKNIQACGMNKRITAVNEDYVEYLGRRKRYSTELVYFDPPWGGPEYSMKERLDLSLSGKDISAVVMDTLKRVAPLVVLKAPTNFNLVDFNSRLYGVRVSIMLPITKEIGPLNGQIIYYLLVLTQA